MPLSYQNYTGDNATTQFSIPFTYQNTTEISVTVDGVAATGLTFPSSSTVQLTSAPASGAIVQVRRTTDLSARAVDFASGSVLTEEDLDDSAIQVFHAAQESKDVVNDTITLDTDLKWEADNKVIKNVANPVNLQDAATKNYIENTWLTTSDKAQLNSLSIPNLNSVATNITDVTTVANNISDVNAFAQVYRSGPTDPTTSLDVGDLFYNTTSNLLKIWNGSSWETGVAGASGLLPLAGGTMTGSIAFSGSQTVDGRDVSADGAKLDLIEAAADVTDAANVNPLVDAHLNTSTAAVDQVLGWTGTDYDWVDNDSGAGDLLAANNLSDLTNTTTARTNLGVAIGSDVQAHSSVLDGTTASFTTAEESKLAGIEAGATADQTNAEIRAAVEAATDSNVFTDADHSKLNAIEAGATADQTGAEIKAAYEAEANTNAFTDAEKTKLTGIEAGATADQTASEIRALVESATDSNVFTDADHTKLNGIEASADVTDVTNVTAAGALMDSEVTNLAQVKAFNSADYATAAQGTLATNALPKSGGAMTGAITTNSTFDGRDVSVDGAKLDGIEAGATADQTGAEIKTAYEAEANTNAFTDAEKTKLTGIEASATADQTASEIRALVESATDSNVFTDADHTKLNNLSITELYGENPVSATTPTATGNNAIAIGSGSTTAGTADGLAIGTDASAAQYATAIGRDSTASGQGATAIGAHDTTVNTSGASAVLGATAVGNSASAQGLFSNAFGFEATTASSSGTSLGKSYSSGNNSLAAVIGNNTSTYGAQGSFAIAIGYLSKATGASSISIGNRVVNTTANQIAIGGDGSVSGTVETVKISGKYTLPIADGTSGQVMTTDGAGTVSFTTVSGGGGALDLYAESYDGTSTAPSATGTNSVAIGKGSTASGQESMAILDGNSVSQDSFSMGGNVYANAIGGIQIGKGGIVGGYGFSANYGVSLGYQGVAAQVESIAIGKGYSGGTNSFTAQITNNTNTYGATGANSIAMGYRAKSTAADDVAIGDTALASGGGSLSLGRSGVASGSYSTAIGNDNIASGGWSSAFGSYAESTAIGAVSISTENSGYKTQATANNAVAIGSRALSAIRGKLAYAGGAFAANGDAQGGQFILRADTTDATATVLTTNNNAAAANNQIVALSDTCITFDGTITAMQNGAQAYASWRIEGLLVNDGGTTTVANSAITVIQNTSNWGLTLTADNTNNALAITFTGEAAHNIRAVANIRTSEVTYA